MSHHKISQLVGKSLCRDVIRSNRWQLAFKQYSSSSINRRFYLSQDDCPNCKGLTPRKVSAHESNLFRNYNLQIYKKVNGFLNSSSFRLINSSNLNSVFQVSLANQKAFFSTSSYRQQSQRGQDEEDEDKDKEEFPFVFSSLFFMGLILFALYQTLRVLTGEDKNLLKYVSWSEFVYDMLAKGEVESVTIHPEHEVVVIKLVPGAVIKGKKAESPVYTMKILDVQRFEEKLRQTERELGIRPENSVSVTYQRDSYLTKLIFFGIIAAAGYMLFKSFPVKFKADFKRDMFDGIDKVKYTRADLKTAQGKGISFKDVAGLQEAKVEIMEFVDYLKRPEKFKELGAKVPKGALLTGPPGCGKTLLAKAVATEARVPFLAMAGSDFVEMIGGLGASRVRDLFKDARKKAPCIIYIDEIDALGKKRGGANYGGNQEEEQTLNQLLVELDGMGTIEGVIMLGSTNRADVLDTALIRPGRFDRNITIDLPTLSERNEIFEMYLNKLSMDKKPSNYTMKLAQMTPGMSGAGIANICNESALRAARYNKKSIGMSDLDYAVERVIAGMAKTSSVVSPSEKNVVAYHESGHALVGWLLEHTDALLKVSIVPRTNNALGFAQYIPSDKKLISTDEMFQKMAMALGGRAAEAIVFNRVTTGAQDDLKRVTQMAYSLIRDYGMNETIGPLSFSGEIDAKGFGKKPYSKMLAFTIDEEAKNMISKAYKQAESLLLSNRDKLETLSAALLEKEVLSYNEVEKLIGVPPYGPKKKFEDI